MARNCLRSDSNSHLSSACLFGEMSDVGGIIQAQSKLYITCTLRNKFTIKQTEKRSNCTMISYRYNINRRTGCTFQRRLVVTSSYHKTLNKVLSTKTRWNFLSQQLTPRNWNDPVDIEVVARPSPLITEAVKFRNCKKAASHLITILIPTTGWRWMKLPWTTACFIVRES